MSTRTTTTATPTNHVGEFRELLEQINTMADFIATTLESAFKESDDLGADQQLFRELMKAFDEGIQPCSWPKTNHENDVAAVLKYVREALRLPLGRAQMNLIGRSMREEAAKGRAEMARREA